MIPKLVFILVSLALPMGCAIQHAQPPNTPRVEVAFSPEDGAEALVLKLLASAQHSVRLAAYSFTSPSVVKGLMEAKRRGVDVKVLVDDKGNRGQASLAAMNLIAGAEIPIRKIAAYSIHHDKYIIVDGRHTETGSFNFSQAAAKSNSENVLVVWDNLPLAGRYLAHWESRWSQGIKVELSY